MNSNYEITEILFSSKSEIVDGVAEDSTGHPCTRKTSLVAHVSYRYKGITVDDEYGTAIVDLGDICNVSIDEDGNLTSINYDDLSSITLNDIKSKADAVIKKQIDSVLIAAYERNRIDTILSEVRSIEGLPTKGQLSGLY